MLECLALEDSCINDTWNWVYANWSWGFFIAVLSLWFTAKALKKTDKANNLAEVSLELTRESTRIAEESLQAAKESIDTSIELYEKQKKDILLEKNSFDNKKIESIKIVIRHELGKMYLNYKGIMTSFEIIKKNDDFHIFSGLTADSEVLVNAGKTSSMFSFNIPQICNDFVLLYDITMLDKSLALKIISMNAASIKIVEALNTLNFVVNDENMNKENKRRHIKDFVSSFEDTFVTYGEKMNSVFFACNDNKGSLESLYKYAESLL